MFHVPKVTVFLDLYRLLAYNMTLKECNKLVNETLNSH